MESASKFVQGTVWHWNNHREMKAGVQSGDRPVLVISNNTFNKHSPVVNCVSITTQLKESPVHVSVHLDKESHIQCEQSHTIPKNELARYIGTISPITLAAVKDKLRYQYDMSTDKSIILLTSIKKSVDELGEILRALDFAKIKSDLRTMLSNSNKPSADSTASQTDLSQLDEIKSDLNALLSKAEKGFGIPEIEDTFLQLMSDMFNSMQKIEANVKAVAEESASVMNKSEVQPLSENKSITDAEEEILVKSKKESATNNRRSKYSEADIDYILDKATPIEEILKKYGIKNKQGVHELRYKLRKRRAADSTDAEKPQKSPNPRNEKKSTSQKRSIKYTDEDIDFILDENNSVEIIMEKYGFENRQKVHGTRYMLKKRREAERQPDPISSNETRTNEETEKLSSGKDRNRYDEEDIDFILDMTNTIEAIMEKYDLKRRQNVHELRYRFKKKRDKASGK